MRTTSLRNTSCQGYVLQKAVIQLHDCIALRTRGLSQRKDLSSRRDDVEVPMLKQLSHPMSHPLSEILSQP